jgi:DNA polymerase III alpha subunit (gram-positive type)
LNNLDYIVFDFETGGLKPGWHEAIQIAGKAYNAKTLEPYVDGEFCSMMKPLHPERLDEDALAVNKKTKEEIMGAPDQKLVWNQFVDWVSRYNPKKNSFTAPIACGKNIRNFDLLFAEELCKKHCKKKGSTVLFNPRTQLDLEDQLFQWFENEPEPANMKMDTVRDYFGMSKEGAHDALVDVRQTGELVMRFLNVHRAIQKRQIIKFKGSLAAKLAA